MLYHTNRVQYPILLASLLFLLKQQEIFLSAANSGLGHQLRQFGPLLV